MRVIYTPRTDVNQVVGGDIRYIMKLQSRLQRLGVKLEIVAVSELAHYAGADLLHLTQIVELDAVEAAIKWAVEKHVPVVLNPLFEEHVAMWFRWAIQRQAKWRVLKEAVGVTIAEHIYRQWQTRRRVSDSRWHRQRAILQCCHVVPNTHYELEHLRFWFRLPQLNGAIVPLGVDGELYGGWKEEDDRNLPSVLRPYRGKYLLEVALINMRKNQIGLLQALAQSSCPIVFLGRPSPYELDYFQEVQELATSRGNVIFIESVEESSLPAIYGNAQLHILPSWSERPGMVSLEAAACGCKVISSNRAPIHEYLGHRAWYVDPANPEDILATVQQVMTSPTPPGLREHALSYDWTNTAQRLTDVYAAILANRSQTTNNISEKGRS